MFIFGCERRLLQCHNLYGVDFRRSASIRVASGRAGKSTRYRSKRSVAGGVVCCFRGSVSCFVRGKLNFGGGKRIYLYGACHVLYGLNGSGFYPCHVIYGVCQVSYGASSALYGVCHALYGVNPRRRGGVGVGRSVQKGRVVFVESAENRCCDRFLHACP